MKLLIPPGLYVFIIAFSPIIPRSLSRQCWHSERRGPPYSLRPPCRSSRPTDLPPFSYRILKRKPYGASLPIKQMRTRLYFRSSLKILPQENCAFRKGGDGLRHTYILCIFNFELSWAVIGSLGGSRV